MINENDDIDPSISRRSFDMLKLIVYDKTTQISWKSKETIPKWNDFEITHFYVFCHDQRQHDIAWDKQLLKRLR